MAPIPVSTSAPVESIDTGSKHTDVQQGVALCIWGNPNFRAMNRNQDTDENDQYQFSEKTG